MYPSRTGARSREHKAPADRTRRQVEEQDRAPSVLTLNPEDKQGEKNKAPNRKPGWGKPVANPEAKGWLETIHRLRVERQHQIDKFLQKEADGTLTDQDKLSIALETKKF